MDLKKFTKELRLILYRIGDPDELRRAFEQVISKYDYRVTLNIIDKGDLIIVDVEPHIQYIRTKGLHKRIYEVIHTKPSEKRTEYKNYKIPKSRPRKEIYQNANVVS